MKTVPYMIRFELRVWRKLQKAAEKSDLSTPQLIRRILNEWLSKDKDENRSDNHND